MPSILPPLNRLDGDTFRRKLAEVVDPNAALPPELQQHGRKHAIVFASVCAQLFGYDQKTKWEKIPAAIQAAWAKTASGDWEYFIHQVMESIGADMGRVACNGRLQTVISYLEEANIEERQAWMSHLATHTTTTMVFARREWQRYLDAKKNGGDVSWWGAEIEFTEGDE